MSPSCLLALAGEMSRGDEGLTVRAVVLADIGRTVRNSRGIRRSSRKAARDLRRGMPSLGGASSSSARYRRLRPETVPQSAFRILVWEPVSDGFGHTGLCSGVIKVESDLPDTRHRERPPNYRCPTVSTSSTSVRANRPLSERLPYRRRLRWVSLRR